MDATLNDSERQSEVAGHGLDVSPYHANKGAVDRSVAVLLLIIACPLMLLLMLLVRMTSKGPAIYQQVRVGKNGRRFRVFKIRTMYQDAEALSGPQWSVKGDPRISPIGRALRFLHLDELPQLMNVVKGEMSLIGPRPERPEFVEKLTLDVPNYRDRLAVLPGITGLAQINLPADETLACVQKKVIVDRHYVSHATAMLDLRILLCTALRMFGIRHGRAARWLGVEYKFSPAGPNLEDTMLDVASPLEDTIVEGDAPPVINLPADGRPFVDRRHSAAYAYAAAPALNKGAAIQDEPRNAPRRPR
jgi:lipopolysaccharide/colanic/teichoic acid biosynthesis glycosyltransferase